MQKEQRIPIVKVITIGFLPSFLKKVIYRLKGYRIEKNVSFSLGSLVIANEACEILEGTEFGFMTIIKANNIRIGRNCQIRSFVVADVNSFILEDEVIISETAIIRAAHKSKNSNIKMEDRVHVFPHTIIDASFPVLLKEECAVGFYSNIYTHGSYKNILDGYNVSYGAVTIGKRVELTYNVFVAPNVTIEDDAIVAYGSYVNKNIPGGVLAGGIPAKVKREKNEFVSVPDDNERVAIISNIFNDFCEHLLYMKYIESYYSESNVWIMKSLKRDYKIKLSLSRESRDKNEQFDVIVSYTKTNFEISESNNYFDIFNLICSKNRTSFGEELKSFLERYGIRFKTKYE